MNDPHSSCDLIESLTLRNMHAKQDGIWKSAEIVFYDPMECVVTMFGLKYWNTLSASDKSCNASTSVRNGA